MKHLRYLFLLVIAFAGCAYEEVPPETLIPIHNNAERKLIKNLKGGSLMLLIQTISVGEEKKEMLEGLWTYVDEAELAGTSQELWNKNGLRIGLAQKIFIKEAQKIINAVKNERTTSSLIQSFPGRPLAINIGELQPNKEIVVYPHGRRIFAESYRLQIEFSSIEINADTATFRITPCILTGANQPYGIELEDLSTELSSRKFQAIILGSLSSEPEYAGSAFNFLDKSGSKNRVLVIIYTIFKKKML